MRDLVCAREDAKLVEKSARQRLGKLLLRHGRRCPGKTNWTNMHFDWIRIQVFEHEAQVLVLQEYLVAVERARAQEKRLVDALSRLAMESRLAPLVTPLCALRGVKLITAASIAFELIDLKRFKTAPKLMGYLGLVPSEHSSGEGRRQGRITKAGNKRLRRLLVEAAHNNRFRPKETILLRERQEHVSPEVREIAWRAQTRLHHRHRTLTARGKQGNWVKVAMARELAGASSIGQQENLLAA